MWQIVGEYYHDFNKDYFFIERNSPQTAHLDAISGFASTYSMHLHTILWSELKHHFAPELLKHNVIEICKHFKNYIKTAPFLLQEHL